MATYFRGLGVGVLVLLMGIPANAGWESNFDPGPMRWFSASTNGNGAIVMFSCQRSMFAGAPLLSVGIGNSRNINDDVDRASKTTELEVDGMPIGSFPLRKVNNQDGSVFLFWKSEKRMEQFDDYERLNTVLRKGKKLRVQITEIDVVEEFDLTDAKSHLSQSITCGLPEDYIKLPSSPGTR